MGRIAMSFFAASVALATLLSPHVEAFANNGLVYGMHSFMSSLFSTLAFVEPSSLLIYFLFALCLAVSGVIAASMMSFVPLICSLGFFGITVLLATGNAIGAYIAIAGALLAGFFR